MDLGIRVDELAALTWSDVNWKAKTIYIHRQESNGDVEDNVKSDSEKGYRSLLLSEAAIEILRRIQSDSKVLWEYIFCYPDGNRIKSKAFDDRMRYAELHYLGYDKDKTKCVHALRRTVGSKIGTKFGVSRAQKWLGHSLKQTTLGYMKNLSTDEEVRTFLNGRYSPVLTDSNDSENEKTLKAQ
jgi:integrase